MIILGIETSCDETAAAVIKAEGAGMHKNISVLANIVSSQINLHKKYGGVVPEVAAREHVLNILPVVNEALKKAGIKRENLFLTKPHPNPLPCRQASLLIKERGYKKEEAGKKIDLIAVTTGPGLITSLLVGTETAKTLSYVWKIPAIGINHIEGHIYANFIAPLTRRDSGVQFPIIILTVSGGHTMLILMKGHGQYEILGETRDDAAGEAFDKAAKILGIGYPGGPIISKYAGKFIKSKINPPVGGQKSKKIPPSPFIKGGLPRPMIDSPNYDFSFSGLKTALLYQVQKDKKWRGKIPEYCHEFQQAVIDVLIKKTIKAAKKLGVKTIMLSGGVAANIELRKQFKIPVKKELADTIFFVPELKYTTDNAAMIAAAGYFRAINNPKILKDKNSWQKLKVDCNLELK